MEVVSDWNELGATILRRPSPVRGIELPTVRNLEEVLFCHDRFAAVLTAGPEAWEVEIGHGNHRVWEFHDSVVAYVGPTLEQVEEMVAWGVGQSDLLVHCHAGMSRSTAVAWGIAIARGLDPDVAIRALNQAHPEDFPGEKRLFIPNLLIVEHLETVLGIGGLTDLCRAEFHRFT